MLMTEDEIKAELHKIAMGRRDGIERLAAYLASLSQPQQPAATTRKRKDENG